MQDLIAILIAAVAAAFLARRAWQQLKHRSSGACRTCAGCSSSNAVTIKQLVTISPLKSQAESQGPRDNITIQA
jgi:hypothetical protein